MTQIFNGYADSGSYPGVDFYRVDIDHAQDVAQHVGGQTVRVWFFPLSITQTLRHYVGAHRSPAFTRTDAARNSARLLAHIQIDCRYARVFSPVVETLKTDE